jgi:hypothetical protein
VTPMLHDPGGPYLDQEVNAVIIAGARVIADR